jgi:hypothetical protein
MLLRRAGEHGANGAFAAVLRKRAAAGCRLLHGLRR